MIGDLPFFLFVFTPLRGAKAGMISNTSDEADSSETLDVLWTFGAGKHVMKELARRMGRCWIDDSLYVMYEKTEQQCVNMILLLMHNNMRYIYNMRIINMRLIVFY